MVKYRQQKRGIYRHQQYVFIIVLSMLSFFAYTQDLCTTLPSGAVAGGFSLTSPAVGCSPFAVTIQDNSGGTDVKYYYYYKGGGLSELATLTPTTALTEIYLGGPTTWTILQVGKKGGKDMYACKNVTVRPNNQPLFTYNSCNNNRLEITIPDTTFNDFDYYTIDWGPNRAGGAQIETVQKTAIPFKNYASYNTNAPTRSIKVEGFYSTPSGCPSPAYKTVSMDGRTSQPALSLEMLPSNKQAILTLVGAYGDDYRLYQHLQGEPYVFANYLKFIKPGKHIIDLRGTTENCFFAYKNTACPEITGQVCTVKLDTILPDGKNNIVAWEQHIATEDANFRGGIYNSEIKSISEKIIKTEGGSTVSTIPNPSPNPYIDAVDCSKDFCYQIETTVNGVRAGSLAIPFSSISLSAKKCISRKALKPPPISDAFASVNAQNSVEIAFTDNSNWTLNKELFRLIRLENGSFVAIDSTINTGRFDDTKVDTEKQSYCYAINYTDECGSTSLNSPTFCTIHLSELNNVLTWTPESPFADQTLPFYEAIFFDEQTNASTTEIKLDSTKHAHTPDLTNFEEFARYQIKTVDSNGKASLSNVLTIPIKVGVFLPTAFTPDGANPVFIPKGNLGRITDFTFSIFNRWGETVFTTKDETTGWDGKINGINAVVGNYAYQIIAKTNTGESIEQKGTVLLMR